MTVDRAISWDSRNFSETLAGKKFDIRKRAELN